MSGDAGLSVSVSLIFNANGNQQHVRYPSLRTVTFNCYSVPPYPLHSYSVSHVSRVLPVHSPPMHSLLSDTRCSLLLERYIATCYTTALPLLLLL